jgi:sialate O-acetylesterase
VRGQTLPSTLWNGRIRPLVPYGIRGAVWYQGESNVGRARQYRRLFPAMIRNWRAEWGRGDFPFYFVQLANFLAPSARPGESAWAELREAQANALEEPATGMAVAIDIGEAEDIHPTNKQEVGRRLALWALAETYGREVVRSGPLYRSMRVEGGRVRLGFDHVGSGLLARGGDGALRRFAVAGADRSFVWAEARIDGDEVVVWSPDVPEPVAVRYAWADNPDGCNLYNREGLPASPFRTDSWPGVDRASPRAPR